MSYTLDELTKRCDSFYINNAKKDEPYIDFFKRITRDSDRNYLIRFGSTMDLGISSLVNSEWNPLNEEYYIRQIQIGSLASHLAENKVLDFASGVGLTVLSTAMVDKNHLKQIYSIEPDSNCIAVRNQIQKHFKMNDRIMNFKNISHFKKTVNLNEIKHTDLLITIAPHLTKYYKEKQIEGNKIISISKDLGFSSFLYIPCNCCKEQNSTIPKLAKETYHSKIIYSNKGDIVGLIRHPLLYNQK